MAGAGVRTLLIDNYDSYTFNLFQMLAVINGEEPIVVRNNSMTEHQVQALLPHVDNVVISPGPGRPERRADFGVCEAILKQSRVPVLGVCLGHQGIAHVHGGRVVTAPRPMHGRLSVVRHNQASSLFEGIPAEFSVVRYHSLIVSELPPSVKATAWTREENGEDIVMALEHASLPQWGVQFHPESISTQYGAALLANFVRAARSVYARETSGELPSRVSVVPRPLPTAGTSEERLHVVHRRLTCETEDTAAVFRSLFASSDVAFWLDTARVVPGSSRFSFMGDAAGPLSFWVCAKVANGPRMFGGPAAERAKARNDDSRVGFFDWLTHEVADVAARLSARPSLPFDFIGGFVGYLGYELRHECGSPGAGYPADAHVPTAFYMLADRVLVYDHVERAWWAVCITDEENKANEWLALVEVACANATAPLSASDEPVSAATLAQHLRDGVDRYQGVPVRLARERAQYLADVRTCQEEIVRGETYEVCLTSQLDIDVAGVDAEALYYRLRKENAAPYGAFLKVGNGVSIASSSPERFLKVGADGEAVCKPIKGTAPRGITPEEDEARRHALATSVKDASENLMIVDLIRNDLGLVCETGSVEVPVLMNVESYATVHQLVSTVVGKIRAGLSAVDCARACFPPGSMTGAPKLRTMDIIDGIERRPRGIYSGALGYFSANGAADLSVVIRTAVVTPTRVTGGAGGAIVALSDADEEFEEMTLKAGSFLPSVIKASRAALHQ